MNEETKNALIFLGIDIGLVSLVFSTTNKIIFWATALGSIFFSIMTVIYSCIAIKSAFHRPRE